MCDFHESTTVDFIASLRPVCEVIFYLLLLGYETGTVVYRKKSEGQESSVNWERANFYAERALKLAMQAADIAAAGDYELADKCANQACSVLESR